MYALQYVFSFHFFKLPGPPLYAAAKKIKLLETISKSKRYSIYSSLIQDELNWAPKKDFLSNLKFTVDWYLQNTKWIDNISTKSDYLGTRLGTTF